MKKKYTIVDNFDKLDCRFAVDESNNIPAPAGTFDINPYVHTRKLDTDTWHGFEVADNKGLYLGSYDETKNGTKRGLGPHYNYTNPLAFGWTNSYDYMPDMLRYITNHRFYISKNSGLIEYQNLWTGDFPIYEISDTTLKACAGKSIDKKYWFFDFLNVDAIFDYNNIFYANLLGLQNYYDPAAGVPSTANFLNGTIFPRSDMGELNTGITYGNYLSFIKKPEVKNAFTLSSLGYISNNILFKQAYNNWEWWHWSKELAYRPANWAYAEKMIDFFENVPGSTSTDKGPGASYFVDLLKKLIAWQTYFIYTEAGPLPGKMHSKKPPQHIYFVSDIEQGFGLDSIKDKEYKSLSNLPVVTIEPVYNYYKKWIPEQSNEDPLMVTIQSRGELKLPNLYTYYGAKTGSKYYKELIRLGQKKIDVSAKDLTVEEYYKKASSAQFSDEPARQPGQAYPISTLDPSADSGLTPYRYRTIIVEDKKFLQDANSLVDGKLFPMYNKITLPIQDSSFMKIIPKSQRKHFISLLANYFSSDNAVENSVHSFALHNGYDKLSNTILQVLDYKDLQKNYKYGDDKYTKYATLHYANDKTVRLGAANSEGMPYLFNTQLFVGSTSETIDEYFHNNTVYTNLEDWAWMKDGTKCHSEIIAFEIAKYKVEQGKKKYIQSIFLSADNDGPSTYFDTQIFYGHEYVYEIFSHTLIIGNNYKYNYLRGDSWIPDYFESDGIVKVDEPEFLPVLPAAATAGTHQFDGIVEMPPNASDSADMTGPWPPITQSPHPIIVRAPYYNTDSLISKVLDEKKETTVNIDFPPMPPDITFYPYKDNANKILILLNINYGQRYLPAMPIFAGEQTKFKIHGDNQQKTTYPYLLFKTDGSDATGGEFEIYRITKKPTSWNAYFSQEPKRINYSKTSGYEDHLHPNTDYYYFARFKDLHGNLSNPTEIYHIRIIKEDGFPPYLVIKTHKFQDGDISYSIPFKKYLKIDLAEGGRKLVDKYASLKDADYEFVTTKFSGQPQPKKYKFRIISKNTGKKIDINLDFTKKIIENYLLKTMAEPVTEEDKILSEELSAIEGKINNSDDAPIC